MHLLHRQGGGNATTNIHSHLDRGLSSVSFYIEFSKAVVCHLTSIQLDHCLLLIMLEGGTVPP